MLKNFLKKKLYSSPGDRKATRELGRGRNRRLFPRFAVNHRHLTAMNEQDILVIRELSAKGLSTLVAPRACERFVVGDVYAARMRYLNEIYDLAIKVTWKRQQSVGFELVHATSEALGFLRRMLMPIALAESLKEVNTTFVRETCERRVRYYGDNDTDLFLWRDADGRIASWQLRSGQEFVEWQGGIGLKTGTVKLPPPVDSLMPDMRRPAPVFLDDKSINPNRKQFAVDVFMALSWEFKEELLATITR